MTTEKRTSPPEHLWLLHGKLYDFSSFAPTHPGGEGFINSGRGKDITEIFESIHILSDRDFPKLIKNYEIKTENGEEYDTNFSWKEDGFYSTLKKKIKAKFQGTNYKATYQTWFKLMFIALLALNALRMMIFHGSFIYSFMYGILIIFLGFCGMHTASHGGLSKNPKINEYFSIWWNSWVMWDHWLWLQHHCIAHHSYTSIYKKDPDVVHFLPLIRKSKDSPFFSFAKFQSYFSWKIISIWPGQFMGQAIVYKSVQFLGLKLFGMKVSKPPKMIGLTQDVMTTIGFITNFVLPCYFQGLRTGLVCIFLMYTALSLAYWANVAPNHDSNESVHALENVDTKTMDWGELQVRSSADHSTDQTSITNYLTTTLFGSMNYQIEHHLFPAINDIHYASIAPIVRDTCKEFNIPYPHHKTWIEALMSVHKTYQDMQTK